MANIAVQNTEISVLNYNEQDYIPLTDMKNADRTVLPFRLDCLCFILERTLWFGTLCRQLCSVKGHRP